LSLAGSGTKPRSSAGGGYYWGESWWGHQN